MEEYLAYRKANQKFDPEIKAHYSFTLTRNVRLYAEPITLLLCASIAKYLLGFRLHFYNLAKELPHTLISFLT